jgi:hypothetical protein
MAKHKHITRLMTIPTSGDEAYAAMESEIAAIPDDQLTRISVDIPYAHRIVIASADKIELYLDDLQQLAFYNMEYVYKIRLIADACRHAHLLATSPDSTDPRAPERVKDAVELRGRLLGSAELLALYGHVPLDLVASIRAGAGNVDLTNDLERLKALFKKLPEVLRKSVLVTDEMIQRAGTTARELAHMFGIREFGGVADVNRPQLMRQKAYLLLTRAYDECRRGITFLRAPHGDADLSAPSLYLKQRKRTSSANVEDEELEPVEPSTDATTPTSTPTPTPTPVVSTDVIANA